MGSAADTEAKPASARAGIGDKENLGIVDLLKVTGDW
jgi:hypothetical protein